MNHKKIKRPVVLAIFIFYVLTMLFLLVIPNNYRGQNVLVGGLTWERWTAHIARGFNLVPFSGIAEQIGFIVAGEDVARNIIYLVGNLVGFAPLGVFLPMLFARPRKFGAFLITVILALIGLELVQLLTMRGSFDIDDIILNTAGACFGFWILRTLGAPNKLIEKPEKEIIVMNFTELFKEITPEELTDNVFKLVGKDFFLVTAGTLDNYNSLVGSGCGFGMLFRRPTSWCVLLGTRYTLELMQKEQTYTLSYFPDELKEKMMYFGKSSGRPEPGRQNDKMINSPLTSIETPLGNMTYTEARLVFECKLTQVAVQNTEDYLSETDRGFIEQAIAEDGERRRYVFGEITKVWIAHR
jgi:glycopeptide antibiotics resistance protein